MFFLPILCLFASTYALPTLELPTPPEAIIPIPEINHATIPSDEMSEAITSPANDKDVKNEDNKEWLVEDEEKQLVPLSALPSPPELPPLDESFYVSLLNVEKPENSQDDYENVRPFALKWKLPKIRFPGRYIINDDVYVPHLSLNI